MTRTVLNLLVASAALVAGTTASAWQAGGTAAGSAHHLDARGQQVMGFDQQKTTHHFFLYDDGGAIDVSVKDKTDKTNLDAIRSHLPHIAHLFGQGQFDAPMLVHDTKDVPGIAELAKLKERVTYTYSETPAGGRVDIVTTDKAALAAVHAFLKFQIADHETGDPATVQKRKHFE
jgi:hypothetical protein